MPKTLGILSYFAAVLFAIALLFMLYEGGVSNELSGDPLIGYFGFGVGVLLLGAGTAHLWEGNWILERLLGWTSALFSLAISASLLKMLNNVVVGHAAGSWWFVPAHLIAIFVLGIVGVNLVQSGPVVANSR